ncbi:hypothetical protein ACFL49_00695 [Candidatus Omnitrophota bacterium]
MIIQFLFSRLLNVGLLLLTFVFWRVLVKLLVKRNRILKIIVSCFCVWLITVQALSLLSDYLQFHPDCAVVKDSPAPGCMEFDKKGCHQCCHGITIIKDLKVEPEISCLKIEENNCEGGMLGVVNECQDKLILADKVFPFGSLMPTRGGMVEQYNAERIVYYLELVESSKGEVVVQLLDDNYSKYIPDEQKHFQIKGSIKGQVFNMSYVKTTAFCDPTSKSK